MSELLFSQETVQTADGSRVHIGFTSLAAGNLGLHVGENPGQVLAHRAQLEEALLGAGAPCGFTYLEQVHGTDVFDADAGDSPRHSFTLSDDQARQLRLAAPRADAASSSAKRPLAIMVADCIPLVFVGEHRQTGAPILGVAHAGRRGLLDGVIQAEVQDLIARGAGTIRAWVGPSICGNCYEVPEDMRAESTELIPEVFSRTSWGTPGLDLPAGARAVLTGLPEVTEVRETLAACTLENPDLFSHRGLARGREAGRIAGLVWVENS